MVFARTVIVGLRAISNPANKPILLCIICSANPQPISSFFARKQKIFIKLSLDLGGSLWLDFEDVINFLRRDQSMPHENYAD
jgi:hypothetical protein